MNVTAFVVAALALLAAAAAILSTMDELS